MSSLVRSLITTKKLLLVNKKAHFIILEGSIQYIYDGNLAKYMLRPKTIGLRTSENSTNIWKLDYMDEYTFLKKISARYAGACF